MLWTFQNWYDSPERFSVNVLILYWKIYKKRWLKFISTRWGVPSIPHCNTHPPTTPFNMHKYQHQHQHQLYQGIQNASLCVRLCVCVVVQSRNWKYIICLTNLARDYTSNVCCFGSNKIRIYGLNLFSYFRRGDGKVVRPSLKVHICFVFLCDKVKSQVELKKKNRNSWGNSLEWLLLVFWMVIDVVYRRSIK